MAIDYKQIDTISTPAAASLFDAADFPDPDYRFSDDKIAKMIANSSIVVVAMEDDRLVGLCLCLSNFISICFLQAIAVSPDHKGHGIGKALIDKSRDIAGGDGVTFVTVSTPEAIGFYENIGLERCRNAFIAARKR